MRHRTRLASFILTSMCAQCYKSSVKMSLFHYISRWLVVVSSLVAFWAGVVQERLKRMNLSPALSDLSHLKEWR